MTSLILAAQAAQGSGMSMIVMLVLMFVIMWFFIIRPQSKRQKEINKFQNSLTEGVRVMTAGGIFGTVRRINIEKQTIEIEIAKGTVVEVDKGHVFASASQEMPK